MPQQQFTSVPEEIGQLPTRLKTELLSDGAYLFADELSGDLLDEPLITCAAWLLELYVLKSGEVCFLTGVGKIRPATNRFGVLYPPFSLVQPCFENPRGHVIGIAASESLPSEFDNTAIVFDTTFSAAPASTRQAIELLRASTNRLPIELNPAASLLSLKAKKLIDTNYFDYPSIARIARRLSVSHAHLSRQFKRDFGMSPSEYLRRLRVADASFRLARGEEIVNVSQDVGYNDLSRFYKQFRKTTNTSPGVCKTLLRPQQS